jgi:hypothetical protein
MRAVLVIAFNGNGSIAAVYEVPGNRASWQQWFGIIRDRERGNRIAICQPESYGR